LSERYFSRNKKYSIKFDKDSNQVDLLKVSRKENCPTLIKTFELDKEEFSPEKYHREKQLAKHVLGYLIKEKKMSMRELNEFALKRKLVSPGELLLDTLTTKVDKK
jgi:hypothetical protein